MDIWYILWSFGIYFPILVFCTNKNLATLARDAISLRGNCARGNDPFQPHSA
jgi:hypothetical protein